MTPGSPVRDEVLSGDPIFHRFSCELDAAVPEGFSPKPIPDPKLTRLPISSVSGPPWEALFLAAKPFIGHPIAPQTPFKSTGSYRRRQSRPRDLQCGRPWRGPNRRVSLRICSNQSKPIAKCSPNSLLSLCFCQQDADLNTNGSENEPPVTHSDHRLRRHRRAVHRGRKYKADVDSATASKRDEHAAIATIELKLRRAPLSKSASPCLGRKPLPRTGYALYALSRLPK